MKIITLGITFIILLAGIILVLKNLFSSAIGDSFDTSILRESNEQYQLDIWMRFLNEHILPIVGLEIRQLAPNIIMELLDGELDNMLNNILYSKIQWKLDNPEKILEKIKNDINYKWYTISVLNRYIKKYHLEHYQSIVTLSNYAEAYNMLSLTTNTCDHLTEDGIDSVIIRVGNLQVWYCKLCGKYIPGIEVDKIYTIQETRKMTTHNKDIKLFSGFLKL